MSSTGGAQPATERTTNEILRDARQMFADPTRHQPSGGDSRGDSLPAAGKEEGFERDTGLKLAF